MLNKASVKTDKEAEVGDNSGEEIAQPWIMLPHTGVVMNLLESKLTKMALNFRQSTDINIMTNIYLSAPRSNK